MAYSWRLAYHCGHCAQFSRYQRLWPNTSLSCYIHGLCLLLSTKFFAYYLNYIPLASLSAILLHTDYKLAKPALFHRKLPKRHESTTAFCHHCTCSFSD
ncbi:MAG: SulP family inorganic anion transporter [Methylococcaceae bacterium]